MDPWRHKVSQIYTGLPPYAPSAALGMYAAMIEEWLKWFPTEQLQVRLSARIIAQHLCRVRFAVRPFRKRLVRMMTVCSNGAANQWSSVNPAICCDELCCQ